MQLSIGFNDSKDGPLEQQYLAPVPARPNIVSDLRPFGPHGNPSALLQCGHLRRRLIIGSKVPWAHCVPDASRLLVIPADPSSLLLGAVSGDYCCKPLPTINFGRGGIHVVNHYDSGMYDVKLGLQKMRSPAHPD